MLDHMLWYINDEALYQSRHRWQFTHFEYWVVCFHSVVLHKIPLFYTTFLQSSDIVSQMKYHMLLWSEGNERNVHPWPIMSTETQALYTVSNSWQL